MGFWEMTFLPAIVDGLKTTIKHVTNYNPVTQQYPEEKPVLPLHYRGVHRLNRDEQGRVKCVACMMCATACPANCIAIEAAAAPPEWPDRDKYPAEFGELPTVAPATPVTPGDRSAKAPTPGVIHSHENPERPRKPT